MPGHPVLGGRTPLLGWFVGAAALAVLLVGLVLALGADPLTYDARAFLAWSHDLRHPSAESLALRLPGWPLALAVARGVTAGAVADAVLAPAVAFGWWAAGVAALRRAGTALDARIASETGPAGGLGAAALAPLIGGLWPFVGLTQVAIPWADAMAVALVALTAAAVLRGRAAEAAMWAALALLTHKAAWLPVAGLMAAVGALSRDRTLGRRAMGAALASLPLALYAGAGIAAGLPATWLVRGNVALHVSSEAGGVASGLLGALGAGGADTVKGVLLVGLVLVAAALTVRLLRRRQWALAALAVPTCVWALLLNAWQVWALWRFGALLALPLAAALAESPWAARRWGTPRRRRMALGSLGALLALSQVAWIVYVARTHA